MANDLDTSLPWLSALRWGDDGLLPAVAVDRQGDVLMLAWVNRQALQTSLDEGTAVYWSRSRQRLWRKGEASGHSQRLIEIRTDCDGDALVFVVEQVGGIACHTGRASCFFYRLDNGVWQPRLPVLKSPEEIYRS